MHVKITARFDFNHFPRSRKEILWEIDGRDLCKRT